MMAHINQPYIGT